MVKKSKKYRILVIFLLSCLFGYLLGKARNCGMWDGNDPSLPGEGLNTGGPIVCIGILDLSQTYVTWGRPNNIALYQLLSIPIHSIIIFVILFFLGKRLKWLD